MKPPRSLICRVYTKPESVRFYPRSVPDTGSKAPNFLCGSNFGFRVTAMKGKGIK
jgi:hypothetical protein